MSSVLPKIDGKTSGLASPPRRNQWRYPAKPGQWLQPQLPEVANVEVGLLVDQILQLQSHIHRLEQIIGQQEAFSSDLELIKPIPGIGLAGRWSILAEIGDIGRFPSDKQFTSYCRLVPVCQPNKIHHPVASDRLNKWIRNEVPEHPVGED